MPLIFVKTIKKEMDSILRKVDISVISDVHLATYACKAKELLKYLKSIRPKMLVLNGDIIDSWRFSRNYFPKPHLKVVRQLIKMLEKGTEIVYITGNHDEVLRKFNNTRLGNLRIVNQLELVLNGNKTWIFHGDVFDLITLKNKWLAKVGAAAYGFLTVINRFLNAIRKWLGKREIILYWSLKERVRKNDKILSRFERSVASVATYKDCDTVICGHIHTPVDKEIMTDEKVIRYINCGDWVEHFSAAEYYNGNWRLFFFKDIPEQEFEQSDDEQDIPSRKQLYQKIIEEIAIAGIF